ncbi:MAG: PilZ domain-containing protein [Proteobacteria bacterium]|nr:PilZ domain-containing protein [Pseudomonadota bacterium]MBU1739410.1 PilZ domain-containing protein [Pseudomonadota bacterium]
MINRAENRRRDVRVTFKATARLRFSENRLYDNCATRNISVSGVLVDDVTGVGQGEKCDVEFHLSGRTSTLVLEMSGEVVRVDENSVALQFFGVDQDSFCHLQNIVYFNYKNPGELGEGYEEILASVDDESLYYGMIDDGALSSGLLSEDDDYDDLLGDDEYGDDFDQDILEQVGHRPAEDEDYH